MTTDTPKAPAKKATAPRQRKLAGAEPGSGPGKRTVITTTGTKELPVAAEPINAAGATANERVPDKDTIVTPGPILEDTTGQFKGLDTKELKEVALFFQKDVVIADPEKGASKNELLAALASGDEDDEPVTWDDYQDIYLATQAPQTAPVELDQANVNEQAARQTVAAIDEAVQADEATVVIKMDRKNPRFDIAGYTFTTSHPYNVVTEKVAAFILKTPGFKMVLPSEAAEYYG